MGYGLPMRGYTNAEHGRDIAYYIDGVPVNDISSIHTPNYADLNILMPETVQSIEVVRGPFNVECGDSNLGGCVNVTRFLRRRACCWNLQQSGRRLPAVLCGAGLSHRWLPR
jgi:outer membrane cobalamin receptor